MSSSRPAVPRWWKGMLADWQVCGHDEGMVEPFRIHLGDRAPVQQSQVTCGSTSLTVARMLVDPLFAREVVEGGAHGCDLPGGNTGDGRLAAIERAVMARTNSLVGPGGRWQLPWPQRLGTPPWGARRELEDGAADVGARTRSPGVVSAARSGSAATTARSANGCVRADQRSSTSGTGGCPGTSRSSSHRSPVRGSPCTTPRWAGSRSCRPTRSPAAGSGWPGGTCPGASSSRDRIRPE